MSILYSVAYFHCRSICILKMIQRFCSFFSVCRVSNAALHGYPRLTDEILEQIRIWVNTELNKSICSRYGRVIYGEDVQKLLCSPHAQHIVKSIDYYVDLIIEKTNRNGDVKVRVMPSQFWENLCDDGYDSACKVAGRADIEDILQLEKVLIVIKSERGFSLAVIYPELLKIKYYDPLNQNVESMDVLNKLEQYIVDDCRIKHGLKFDMTRWVMKNVKNIPEQMNDHDSGVFVCACAESIARTGRDFFCTREELPYFRHKIAYEICTGQMLS